MRRPATLVVAILVLGLAGCAAEPRTSSVSETPLPSPSESVIPSATASPGVPIGPLPFGRIAYDRFDAPDSWEADTLGTFTLAADGTGEQELTVDVEGDTYHPVLSPDGTRVALTVFTPPMGPAVTAVADLDGSNLVVREPEGLSNGFFSCEDWSPDGSRLLCTWDDDAHPESEGIYSLNANGSDVVRITTSPNPGVVGSAGECGGNDFNAAYSPDGTEIVFVRGNCGVAANPSDDQTGALYRVGVDGSNLEEIVPPGEIHSHGVACPSWSPDGSQIVFVTEGGELQLLANDGVVPIEIQGAATGRRTYAFCPAWSPDGEWIITSLFTDASGTTDLYIVHPDGTELTRITDAPGTETYVSWVTDGDPLAGTWSTGSVSFSDVQAAMLDAGLEDSDFAAWAEGQDLAPWPEDPATPSEIAMELQFTTDGRWQVSVESGGQSIGVVDAGTYELRDAELDLTSAADGDVGTFGAELGTNSLTLELLDTVEVGSAGAAYIHQLYAIALFASAPFERD